MSRNTLYQFLESAPPDAVCLIFEDRAYTYGEVRERVARIAGGLAGQGVARGDVVAIWLPNTPEWIMACFACAMLGAPVLSLNMRFGTREVGDFIRRAACKALIYTRAYRERDYQATLDALDPASRATLRLLVPLEDSGSGAGAGAPAPLSLATLAQAPPLAAAAGLPEDGCVILSSSGTTSLPKLIVHTQERVCRHIDDITRAFGIVAPGSRVLLGIPFCGAFGYTVALAALGAHAALVVMEQFAAQEAADLLGAHGITHMFGTNDMLDKILLAAGPGWRAPALQMYGHANFTPGLADLPQRAAQQGVRMRGCFGMSETLALFASQPADADLARRAQSGGVPLSAAARVRVRSLETGALLAPGETGEIEVLTPDVMAGYLGNPAATAAAFTEDGYLRTGDLGYLSADGGFMHVSRIGDVLRIGGYLVNPLEIEEVILHDGGVQACQVVEVKTQHSTRPVAFVIGAPGYCHDEAAVLARCRAQMAIFKVPLRVFQVEGFPTTPSPNGEKVRKNELREWAERLLNESGVTQ